jgi:hypothetical protein
VLTGEAETLTASARGRDVLDLDDARAVGVEPVGRGEHPLVLGVSKGTDLDPHSSAQRSAMTASIALRLGHPELAHLESFPNG